MKSLFKKEIIQFFSSPIGYISMGIFYLLSSLFLWVMEGPYNIIDHRFADLSPFFQLAPWILMFVIAAIGMKTFSEEFRSGTIETLLTKPLKPRDLVLGKFFALWWAAVFLLIPSLIYVASVYYLTQAGMQVEKGIIWSSYFGLILLEGVFASIAVFTSLLFKNQVSAFLTAIILMFLFYYGFEGIGNFNLLGSFDYFIQSLSIKSHYENFIKGLIKIPDIFYFLLLILFFLALSVIQLQKKQYRS